MLGLSLPEFLSWKAAAAPARVETNKAFGAAKSVMMLFLQGGPSHIDIWDPKPDAPANIRGEFKAIKTKVSGIQVSEMWDSGRCHGAGVSDPDGNRILLHRRYAPYPDGTLP